VLGYEIGVQMGSESMSITPTLAYNYSKNVAFNLSSTLDSSLSLRNALGV